MKKLLTLLSLAAFSLPAQNLIFNGELELGTDGYACRTILRPDTNPKLVYTPLETTGERARNSCSSALPSPNGLNSTSKSFR